MPSINRVGRVSSIDYKAGTYEVTYFDRGQSVTRKINAMSNGEYKMPNIGQIVSVSHQSNGPAAATTTGTVWNKTNKPVEGYKGLYRKDFASRKGRAYDRYDENTGVFKRIINGENYVEAGGAATFSGGGQVQLMSRKGSASVQGKTGVGLVSEKIINAEAGTVINLDAKEEFNTESGKDTTFTVGGSSIKIGEDGIIKITGVSKIELVAPQITINGVTVSITGASGDVKIKGISLVEHTHKDSGEGKPQ